MDVTLAVDGKYLKAHKMVLSACSPYFQALFVGHPDKHPIVILKDIPYTDMRSLLDFMYRGEVSVDQDRLTMFLKVAESLRIKGLTEVNEDQCDLPKIASSLLSSTQQQSHPLSSTTYLSNFQQNSLLPRLKRPSSSNSLNSPIQSSNPLLGSALTAPKRKRGLPRRLSGSESDVLIPEDGSSVGGMDGEVEDDFEDGRSVQSDSDMIDRSDSPFDNKMLEVNVSEGTRRPSEESSSACNTSQEDASVGATTRDPASSRSPSPAGRDSNTPGGGDTNNDPGTLQDPLNTNNVKSEPISDNNNSGEQNDRNSSSSGAERFPPGLLRLIPRSELISHDKLVENSLINKNHKNGQNLNNNGHLDNINLLKNLILNSNVDDNNKQSFNKHFLSQVSNEHKFILSQIEQFQKNNNFSLHQQSQQIHNMLQANANGNGLGNPNENHNFLQPTERNSNSVRRRIRRRATSSSDPTESLTEMSVRGLNLFRYASVNEGIYKCMECAKVDVIKTFKNKYSFQRHAFLYHEGCQRKVFPCPVCGKEFSRPDKMKNHMKTVHDCFMPSSSSSANQRMIENGTNLSIFATTTQQSAPLVPFFLPP